MERHNARYDDPSSGFNSSRGYMHARRNAIHDTDIEHDDGYAAFQRATDGYNDPHGDDLRHAMYNADRRESRGGSAARARGRGRGGYGGRGEIHGRAHENPYHGVEAFPTDDEDSEPEIVPRGVTRFHRRRGESMGREEAHLGSRRGHGGGGRVDPRDGSFGTPDARFSHSHHHHGYDERAGQDLSDADDDDDDDSSSDDDARMHADSEDERLQAYGAGRMRAEARRAAAGHNDRYGGPARRY